ncbi:MAG: polyprenyl synthetase family protein [Desulfamplus sp.]|nr:polyprenyl synthetase family protein [Desulfamplus sp.]
MNQKILKEVSPSIINTASPKPAHNQPPFKETSHNELKNRIVSKVSTDLANIEKTLHDNLTPNLSLVSEIAGHLLFSGGKRLRPLLMLLSSRLCTQTLDKFDVQNSTIEQLPIRNSVDLFVKFSTIFEYLHAATLLHDDVVDEAQMRRGKPSAHSRWSVPKVVLTGDFLLARSLSLAAETKIPEIIAIMAKITEDMSQGEIEQMEYKSKVDLTESQYLKIIERKTAVLIQGACRSGAILAHRLKNGSKSTLGHDEGKENFNWQTTPQKMFEYWQVREEALDRYGYHLGIAFQMADDLLDYTGDAAALGKNPGADIREGKLTLPLIHALSKANDEDSGVMKNIILNCCGKLEDFNNSFDNFSLMLEKINKYKGIEYTESHAKHHVEQAKKSLELFQDCEAKEILMLLADYSISRKV